VRRLRSCRHVAVGKDCRTAGTWRNLKNASSRDVIGYFNREDAFFVCLLQDSWLSCESTCEGRAYFLDAEMPSGRTRCIRQELVFQRHFGGGCHGPRRCLGDEGREPCRLVLRGVPTKIPGQARSCRHIPVRQFLIPCVCLPRIPFAQRLRARGSLVVKGPVCRKILLVPLETLLFLTNLEAPPAGVIEHAKQFLSMPVYTPF